jgi:hypothetical protein
MEKKASSITSHLFNTAGNILGYSLWIARPGTIAPLVDVHAALSVSGNIISRQPR